jgi:N-acylglucosamine 2-epimerase
MDRHKESPQTYTKQGLNRLAAFYHSTLLDDVIPFWLEHGLDRKFGGFITALGRDGSVIDSDKSVWFQGRAAWMFATLFNTIERQPEWLDAAESCIEFMRRRCFAPSGKMYFSVTRSGAPLRMRRYAFSDSFAAIGFAAWSVAAGDRHAIADAARCFTTFLRHHHSPGLMSPKTEQAARPTKSLAPLMTTIATAQELRALLGDISVEGATCSRWIDRAIGEIQHDFLKPRLKALLECVGPNGQFIDHADGRLLNPGHALQTAWLILREARLRDSEELETLGLTILDWMWERGWDKERGGIFCSCDVKGLPPLGFSHDMKFCWPHNEAINATLLAYVMTHSAKYAQWHRLVHDWSFSHFADKMHGEWFGYLHRDGSVASQAKGSMWKGPFHLPRMLWYCGTLLGQR